MLEPPTGTVTFLFTDIEGSTKLWEKTRRPCGQPSPATTRSSGELESGEQALIERLKDHLHGRQLLLLMDNFEQVLEATSLVGSFSRPAPSLRSLRRAAYP
jgi:hypothetical protein